MAVLYLGLAILIEIAGTTFLKLSDGFSKAGWSAASLASYATAIFLLSRAIQEIPVGVAYAVWSVIGVAAITLIGWLVFDQRLTAGAIAGIALIVIGVMVLQLSGGETP